MNILLGLRFTSIMVVFCLLFPVILKLDKTNRRLLGIYKLIPLQDIRTMQDNLEKFMAKNLEVSNQPKTISEIQ